MFPIPHCILNFTLFGGGGGGDYGCHSIFVLRSRKNTNLKWLFLLYMVFSWSHRIWRLKRELGHLLQPYTVSKILWACGHFHHLKKTSLGSTAHVSSSQSSPLTTPYVSRLTENQDLLVYLFAYVWIFYRRIFVTVWQIHKRGKGFSFLA